MSKIIAVSAVLLLCLSLSSAQDQTPKSRSNTEAVQNRPPSTAEDAASRVDLQKMKSLVQQMQTNLAFVTSTQGPLKHQFELEIEMWQLEIARLERRLDQKGADETKK